MRVVGLAVLALLAGCDAVFGLDRDPVPADAAPDGSPVIVDLAVDGPVLTSSKVAVHAKLHHLPGERVTFTLAANAGTVLPASDMVTLDQFGVGDLMAAYASPDVPGDVEITAEALGESASTRVRVLTAQAYGHDGHGDTGAQIATGDIYGFHLTIAQPGTLVALGLWTDAPAQNGNIRLALYSDHAMNPSALVGETGSRPLTPGRNVFGTPGVPVAAGDYWMLSMVDLPEQVRATSAAGALAFGSGNFTEGFHPSYPDMAFNIPVSPAQPAFFALVAP